ncbi:hypothetical protein LCGC14_3156620 [marine sediment metagenome]|uniref:Uncharacterized protein n=1 Tax=marine sediment metagenome TaxID=412755 RepID=A0A0F8VSI6_9ZZZZ
MKQRLSVKEWAIFLTLFTTALNASFLHSVILAWIIIGLIPIGFLIPNKCWNLLSKRSKK